MNTIENYPTLLKYDWEINNFTNDCLGKTFNDFYSLLYKVSTAIDEYLLNTHKYDEVYLINNEDRIRSFKSFITKLFLYIPFGTEEAIRVNITDKELSELKRLRNGLIIPE